MNRFFYFTFVFIWFAACETRPEFNQETVSSALENGQQANKGFDRSLLFVNGWLTKTDSTTGLIPTNLTRKTDVWEPHNSAADNYAFMVLTAFLLDKELYNGELREMLKTEKELTSRINSLPDTWSFSKQDFLTAEPQPGNIIFGEK